MYTRAQRGVTAAHRTDLQLPYPLMAAPLHEFFHSLVCGLANRRRPTGLRYSPPRPAPSLLRFMRSQNWNWASCEETKQSTAAGTLFSLQGRGRGACNWQLTHTLAPTSFFLSKSSTSGHFFGVGPTPRDFMPFWVGPKSGILGIVFCPFWVAYIARTRAHKYTHACTRATVGQDAGQGRAHGAHILRRVATGAAKAAATAGDDR